MRWNNHQGHLFFFVFFFCGWLEQKEGRCNKKKLAPYQIRTGFKFISPSQDQTTIRAYYWVPWQEIIDMETPSQSKRGHGNPFPREKRSSQMLIPQKKAFHRVGLRYHPGGQHLHQVHIGQWCIREIIKPWFTFLEKKTRKTFQSKGRCTSINTGWSQAGWKKKPLPSPAGNVKPPKRRPFLTNVNNSVGTARSSTLKQTKDPSKRRK